MASPEIKPLWAEHASPESILHQLDLARANRDRWQRHTEALTRLLDHRLGQIEAGTWPLAEDA